MTLEKNVSLKTYNTFRLPATARWFAAIHSVADLEAVFNHPDLKDLPRLIIGGGSNLLFTQDVEGLVLLIRLAGITQVDENDEFVWLKAGAGENWHTLVLHTLALNLGGLENLSLIPGTVGAAPLQNIGAYGSEIRDTLESLEAFSVNTHILHTFTNADCRFGYRESIFKNEYKNAFVITSVTFRLRKNPLSFQTGYGDIQKTLSEMGVVTPTLQAVSEAIIRIRRSKLPDPQQIGNAGSFFKNPEIPAAEFESLKARFPTLPGYPVAAGMVKVPAGWLIEQAGWKGVRQGEAGVHDRQALVLVNYGNATGEAIWQLALQIQASVRSTFGITLSPEVNRV